MISREFFQARHMVEHDREYSYVIGCDLLSQIRHGRLR